MMTVGVQFITRKCIALEKFVHKTREPNTLRSWYGHEQVVQKLLTELGANVNAQTRETVSTPLHFAAGCGHQPIVRLLLCHQANHSVGFFSLLELSILTSVLFDNPTNCNTNNEHIKAPG
eukprot:TRINITY_DN506_c0_g1_i4.p1 TRINITY_DN506_c0_g1~~TRINITY_DN506_c0_g1_i4.p1  ORF type:complete len:120 (-),score=2.32 TRINITY_DN506_c0_g1_i4:153-512(-)